MLKCSYPDNPSSRLIIGGGSQLKLQHQSDRRKKFKADPSTPLMRRTKQSSRTNEAHDVLLHGKA
jgi:hypothetical protein